MVAVLVRSRRGGGCRARSTRDQPLNLAAQLPAHAYEGLDQLNPGALRRGRAEDRLGVLEPRVRTKRDVAEAQHSEQTDARFHAAAAKYSEHRDILSELA